MFADRIGRAAVALHRIPEAVPDDGSLRAQVPRPPADPPPEPWPGPPPIDVPREPPPPPLDDPEPEEPPPVRQ